MGETRVYGERLWASKKPLPGNASYTWCMCERREPTLCSKSTGSIMRPRAYYMPVCSCIRNEEKRPLFLTGRLLPHQKLSDRACGRASRASRTLVLKTSARTACIGVGGGCVKKAWHWSGDRLPSVSRHALEMPLAQRRERSWFNSAGLSVDGSLAVLPT
jgi:hypothetical protein